MKTLKYMMAAAVLQAACMAVADMIPGDWRVDVGKRSVFRKEIYQGESVRLEATFFRDGKEFTPDFAAPMLYWQTNGMGRSYFSAPAVVSSNAVCAVWDGSKDCGARYYHGFIGETGVTYRAEFEFKMVPSPGFRPNALPLPVEKLDFAAVAITNAPYYTRAETGTLVPATVSNIVTRAYVEDLGISSNESDPVWQAEKGAFASAATNYTDAAFAGLRHDIDLYVRSTNAWLIVSNGVFYAYYVSTAGVKTLQWSVDQNIANDLAALARDLVSATNAQKALIDRAPSHWGEWASSGASNNYPNCIHLDRRAIFSDGSVVWEGTNGFFAVSAASAFSASGTAPAFRIGSDADTWFGLEVQASYLVGIRTGGIAVDSVSGTVTMRYDWRESFDTTPPKIYYSPDLINDFQDIEGLAFTRSDIPDKSGGIYTVILGGISGSAGYFTAKDEVAGGAVMRSTIPIFADGYYIAPSNAAPQIVQPDSVFTISTGGHTYRVFGERID